MRKLPSIKTGCKILIICEGFEEYDYITKLKECGVWSSAYNIKPRNAKSIDNIIAIYQNEYQNSNYDLVIILCDTEILPYEQFCKLREAINSFHGNNAADKLIIFANPCTMQIILSHFDKVKLMSNSKTQNSPLIKKLTGVADYIAEENQRKAIMKHINAANYLHMKSNLKGIAVEYDKVPSTNVVFWFNLFESENTKWVKETNKEIEK
ncbi:MAG: hypothetical protein K2K38_01185 [Clostridia bacterium]|nr:hypothetical protein [Clostridia bacterium]